MTRVVVLGMMGRTPFAGVAWQVLQYLEGFRRAGCDVFYVEDTGAWPYDPVQNTITNDAAYTVGYIARALGAIGLGGRWAYVAPDSTTHGMETLALDRLFRSADVLVNLTGATVLRDIHLAVPVRLYVETDPVAPQVEVALGNEFTIDLLRAHTHHFTFGENLGAVDCGVPVERYLYRPTRQPVVLDWWRVDGPLARDARFTTIASWRQTGRDVDWRGETYFWSKDREFLKVLDLPRRVPVRLELALACDDAEAVALLRSHGWGVVDALPLSIRPEPYREYVLASRGEFTVAKDQNVRLRSGWFSDRSACYLAAGKPVVTQDTGFGNVIPVGEGVFAFANVEDAAAAIAEIERDYDRQSRAAAEVAAEYFAAETVTRDLLAAASVSGRAAQAHA